MSDLEKLQEISTKEVIDFFTGPETIRESKSAMFAANLAVKSLSAVGRLKATERVRDATQFTVLKHIAEDEKQFREYLKIAMPQMIPPKLLSRPKK